MSWMEDLLSPRQREWYHACTRAERVTADGYAIPQRVQRQINTGNGDPLYKIGEAWSDHPPALAALGARSYTDVPYDEYYPPVTWLAEDYFPKAAPKENLPACCALS